MHASIEQLLSLRDEVAVDAEVKTHVETCAVCRKELDRLDGVRRELRSLPPVTPPPDAWSHIERRRSGVATVTSKNAERGPVLRLVALAAALAVIGVLVLQSRNDTTPVGPATADTTPVPEPVSGIDLLAERSQQLELALGALGDQPSVVRARTAETIATLEDRLAIVDYQLSYANAGLLPDSQSEALWRERVDLMNSLVQVRYAEVQRISY